MSIIVLVLSLGRQICEYPDTTLFQPDRQRAGGTSGVFTGIDRQIDMFQPYRQRTRGTSAIFNLTVRGLEALLEFLKVYRYIDR